MNYIVHYEKLISKARNRSILKSKYKEKHHIIPKCIGGTNLKENIIELFPEEHYLAHQLLVKIHPTQAKLIFALNMMNAGSKYTIRNNKQFGWIKRIVSKAKSQYMKGRFLGRTHSTETTLKISRSNTGKPGLKGDLNPTKRPEVQAKMRKPKSETGKRNIRIAQQERDRNGDNNSFYGKTHTKESLKLIVTNRKSNNKGEYHPNGNRTAKTFKVTSPKGNEYIVFNSSKKFGVDHNINFGSIRKCNGHPYVLTINTKKTERMLNSVGWSIIEIVNQ